MSGMFSGKRTGLAEVGGERHRFRAGQSKGGKRQGQGWQEHQVLRLEDLQSWWDGGEEVTV